MKFLRYAPFSLAAGLLLLSHPAGSGIAAPILEVSVPSSTKSVAFVIPEAPGQTYDQLAQTALMEAQALVGRTFAENPEVTAVLATVLAERKGQELPLIVVRVSRQEWQNQPFAQTWGQQAASIPTQVLLGFLTPDLKPVPEPVYAPSYAPGGTGAPTGNSGPTNSDYSRYNDPNEMVR